MASPLAIPWQGGFHASTRRVWPPWCPATAAAAVLSTPARTGASLWRLPERAAVRKTATAGHWLPCSATSKDEASPRPAFTPCGQSFAKPIWNGPVPVASNVEIPRCAECQWRLAMQKSATKNPRNSNDFLPFPGPKPKNQRISTVRWFFCTPIARQ